MENQSSNTTSGFFVFEGVEGSGKSTLIEATLEYYNNSGIPTIKTREPGGTGLGKAIRETLLNQNNQFPISPLAELLMFFSDRAQHLNEVILPSLSNNQLVLCDRFTYSTIAYQVYGRGLERRIVDELSQAVLANFSPTGVILLDIDPIEALKRAKSRSEFDRFESEDLAFHNRIRKGYLDLANEMSELFIVLDSNKPTSELLIRVIDFINKKSHE